MILLEFIIFVVSSGLFCSEKFRGHIWAVIVAGVIATGSSLLFMYDLGAKLTGHEKEPPVITKIVRVPVVKTIQNSQPASASKNKPHTCGDEYYPAESVKKGEDGNTKVGFTILTDGTVGDVKVLSSSGSPKLDDATVKCVATWHYRPAIKDGNLAEVASSALVKWVLPQASQAKPEPPAKADDEQKKPEESAPATEAPSESRHWYDPRSWFSSEPEKQNP